MAGGVKVIVAKDGSSTTTEVEGIKGSSCKDVTKNLIEALGSISTSEDTPEMFEENIGEVPTYN